MRTIHKFPLSLEEPTTVILPIGAKIVDFNAQGRELFFWALVNTNALYVDEVPVTSTFRVLGTGHPIPNGYEYRHTCHVDGYVWHLFERL